MLVGATSRQSRNRECGERQTELMLNSHPANCHSAATGACHGRAVTGLVRPAGVPVYFRGANLPAIGGADTGLTVAFAGAPTGLVIYNVQY
jgi:hypothetical protein